MLSGRYLYPPNWTHEDDIYFNFFTPISMLKVTQTPQNVPYFDQYCFNSENRNVLCQNKGYV